MLTPTGAGAQRHEFAARLENRRPMDGEPDAGRLLVFVAEGWQAVNYDVGVWHAPMRALGDPGAFVMLRWDDGSGADTEFWPLPEAIVVDLLE